MKRKVRFLARNRRCREGTLSDDLRRDRTFSEMKKGEYLLVCGSSGSSRCSRCSGSRSLRSGRSGRCCGSRSLRSGRCCGGDNGSGTFAARSEEDRRHGEDNEQSCKSPSGFLHHVGGLSHAHDLIGGCKVGSQTAALRFLNENNQSEENGCNYCQND